MSRACYICQSSTKELRPYGKGGQDICFSCMSSSPEREAEAKKNFAILLDTNSVIGHGVVAVGSEDGPTPFEVPNG